METITPNLGRYKHPRNMLPLLKYTFLVLVSFFIAHNLSNFVTGPSSSSSSDKDMNIQIYSHNIRFDNKGAKEAEKPWSERKIPLTESVSFHSFGVPTVVCLQEVLKNQLDDILALLNQHSVKEDDWTYFGVGRNDGKEAGEYSPVIYRKSDFELLEGGSFWLSETPNVPSRGWDADQTRIATWTHLKHRQSGEKINVFNTHLDHKGQKSREEAVKLIAQKTRSYNDDVSFIAGDFNSEPHEEAYQTLKNYLKDTRLYNNQIYGYKNTFTGFDDDEEHKVIDYVFVDDRVKEAKLFGVLENKFNFYSSDHRPLLVKFEI